MENSNLKPEYVSVAGLKARRWTEGAIKKYLGEPDKLAQNPYCKKSGQVKLYLLSRIREVEESSKFILWLEESQIKRNNQSEAQKVAISKKKAQNLHEAETLEVNIPVLNEDELLAKTLDYCNSLFNLCGNDKWTNISGRMRDEFAVNMLKHPFLEYKERFDRVASYKLTKRIVTKISEIYPHLKEECRNQS